MDKDSLILIVEDELLIADHISRVLKSSGYTNNFYVTSLEDAITAIEKERPVIVLTDITLINGQTGIELGELLHSQYKIPFIYITSHSSPEMISKVKFTYPNAYLVKPFKKEDLIIAIELALFNSKPVESTQFLQIKDGHAIAQIPVQDILWLEADGNYTVIYTESQKKRLLRSVITELHSQLPAADFIRIHRSYVVNRSKISEYASGYVLINGTKLPVGRTYKDSLLEVLD